MCQNSLRHSVVGQLRQWNPKNMTDMIYQKCKRAIPIIVLAMSYGCIDGSSTASDGNGFDKTTNPNTRIASKKQSNVNKKNTVNWIKKLEASLAKLSGYSIPQDIRLINKELLKIWDITGHCLFNDIPFIISDKYIDVVVSRYNGFLIANLENTIDDIQKKGMISTANLISSDFCYVALWHLCKIMKTNIVLMRSPSWYFVPKASLGFLHKQNIKIIEWIDKHSSEWIWDSKQNKYTMPNGGTIDISLLSSVLYKIESKGTYLYKR